MIARFVAHSTDGSSEGLPPARKGWFREILKDHTRANFGLDLENHIEYKYTLISRSTHLNHLFSFPLYLTLGDNPAHSTL